MRGRHSGSSGSLRSPGFARLMVARRHIDLLRVNSALCSVGAAVR
ncbi:putative leader peptide [Streptomyces sp. V4-01]|uniref:Leader peptide n=1 Tax=Actinacidiphila polyblastidii TaxID=3110430 RepID=A0ABU7P5K0_9ACTN|nr:putative leader peptide [Streptomyces sp. V4-01]